MNRDCEREKTTTHKVDFDEAGIMVKRPGEKPNEAHDPTYRADIPYIHRGRHS